MTILAQYRNGFKISSPYIDVQWGGEADGNVPVWSAATGTYVPKIPPGGSPSGAAGGGLAGTYPNPTLATTQAPAITWGALQTFSLGISIAGGQAIGSPGALTVNPSGALTLTSGQAATWSTSVGALTIDAAAGLNLGATTATSIAIGSATVAPAFAGGITIGVGKAINGGAGSLTLDTTGALNVGTTNATSIASGHGATAWTHTGSVAVTQSDATATALTLATFSHVSSAPAAGVGVAMLFQASNTTPATVSVAEIDAILTTATAASEASAIVAKVRTGGAALTEAWRTNPSGAISLGTFRADPGVAAAISVNATGGLYYDSGAAFYRMVGIGSGYFAFGNSSLNVQLIGFGGQILFGGGTNIYTSAANAITFNVNASHQVGQFLGDASALQLGEGDASATPLAFAIKGASSRGGTDTNVSGSVVTHKSGLGTGNSLPAYVSLQGAVPTTSGTTAQAYGESLRAYGVCAQHTAGMAITRSVQSTTYQALATDLWIRADTNTAGFTVTLPAANAQGNGIAQVLYIEDKSGTFSTHNLTVTCAGTDHYSDGVTTSKALVTNRAVWKFVSDGSSQWAAFIMNSII